jgi:hypothetical protein
MIHRITGQEAEVRLMIDGKVVKTLRDITIEFPTMPADDYLGESKPHPLGDLGRYEVTFTADPASAPAWNDFVHRLGEKARAEGRRALAEHILAGGWIGKLVVHPGGLYLATVLRMEATPVPGQSIYRELRRISFDDGYDPDPEAQRRALQGAAPRPEQTFSTPTLDEIVGQLERSEHPWVAMEVGKSGCVDTICVPRGATP